MNLRPITLRAAGSFIARNHRHHVPSQGGLFAVAVEQDGLLIGVAVVGRPVARKLCDGYTAEVTRLCSDGSRNVCSMLYAAAWRACRSLGYRKLVTYILSTEPGTSLVAAGWKCIGETPGKSWSVKSRPRLDKHPLGKKRRYQVCIDVGAAIEKGAA